jgi:hypothetical protein
MATKTTNRHAGTGLTGQQQSALWWAATFATLRRLVNEIQSVTDASMDERQLDLAADKVNSALDHLAAACPDTAARVPVPV